jgi:hypothetical protein
MPAEVFTVIWLGVGGVVPSVQPEVAVEPGLIVIVHEPPPAANVGNLEQSSADVVFSDVPVGSVGTGLPTELTVTELPELLEIEMIRSAPPPSPESAKVNGFALNATIGMAGLE